jgi:hypothetical protein
VTAVAVLAEAAAERAWVECRSAPATGAWSAAAAGARPPWPTSTPQTSGGSWPGCTVTTPNATGASTTTSATASTRRTSTFTTPRRCLLIYPETVAIYPETVALTSLLASPYWRKKITSRWPRARPARDASAREAFHAEFARRVAPHHHQHTLVERLVQEHLTDPERRCRLANRQP